MTLRPKNSTDLGGPFPAPGSQRRGRDLQRYTSAQERLVAGCIPLRWEEGAIQCAEVLMISSSSGSNSNRGYVFPKGGWETDETVLDAAARETLEEAGVRGVLEQPLLGAFGFNSSKAGGGGTQPGRCIAYMFAMRVEEELPVWPEKAQRNRLWVPLYEACGKCKHEWMHEALKVWMARHGLEKSSPASCQHPSNSADAAVQTPAKLACS